MSTPSPPPSKVEENTLDRKLRATELITNLSSRQSSTLVIATVASSASLALLALSSNPMPIPYYDKLAGFLFPIAGMLYRQLTTLSDKVDRRELDEYRGGPLSQRPDLWIIRARKGILLLLLGSPSALWWLQIYDQSPRAWVAGVLVGLVTLLVAFEDHGFNQHDKNSGKTGNDEPVTSLIERVDRDFKGSRIPRSLWPLLIAAFLPFLLAVQLSLIFYFGGPGLIFTSTGTAFLALILSNISVGFTLFAVLRRQLPRGVIDANFAQMKNAVPVQQSPILYGLIALKTKAPIVRLLDSYHVRPEFFGNESLLKIVYEHS